jgi:DNA-directed RNA polymerase specialized sigma subunit
MNKQQSLDNLKQFRTESGIKNSESKQALKRQLKIKRTILEVLANSSKTIPELAAEIEYPAAEIFWHINAMRKYGDVEFDAEVENYIAYKLIQDDPEECALNVKDK